MLKYARVINEKTKECQVGLGNDDVFYKSLGMTKQDVEVGYDGNWYLVGYTPKKPQEIKEQDVKAVREQYFANYVDWYQSKPLMWEEMTDEEKQDIADYRKYLMDYTKQENWWEKNPLNFEEWKNANLA